MGKQSGGEKVRRVKLHSTEFAVGQSHGEIQAVYERGGVHPVVSGHWVSGGRLHLVERLAHARDGTNQNAWVGRVRVCGAEGRGDKLKRCLDLVAIVGPRPELWRVDHSAQYLFDVSVRREIGPGHAVYQR